MGHLQRDPGQAGGLRRQEDAKRQLISRSPPRDRGWRPQPGAFRPSRRKRPQKGGRIHARREVRRCNRRRRHQGPLPGTGSIFLNNQTCITIYSDKHDATQERSAQEIARFSRKDAEKYLRCSRLDHSIEYQRVQMDSLFMPAEFSTAPAVLNRQMEVYPKLLEVGFQPDSLVDQLWTVRQRVRESAGKVQGTAKQKGEQS